MIILCELVSPAVDQIILMIIFFVLIWLVVTVVVTRWIFRINEQIELLSQIRDELKIFNSSGNEDT